MKYLREMFSRKTDTPVSIEPFIKDARESAKRADNELQKSSDTVKYLKSVTLDPPPFERDMFPREAKKRTER